jgi:hypothetical protein
MCHSRGSGNPAKPLLSWIPAPRFCGDKFTPAKAGAGMTNRIGQFKSMGVLISKVWSVKKIKLHGLLQSTF